MKIANWGEEQSGDGGLSINAEELAW